MAYLGLGANLGNPRQQLLNARDALSNLASTESLRCSQLFRSSPVGDLNQPEFANCVIELETRCKPLELLDAAQAIESSLGRQRVAGNQNAARTIDIDILLYGDDQIESERLLVPHPRMHERLFVLKPLLELVEIESYRHALEHNNFHDQVISLYPAED